MNTRAEHLRQLGNQHYMSLDFNWVHPSSVDRAKALKNSARTHLRVYEFQCQRQIVGKMDSLSEAASNLYTALSLNEITEEWYLENIPLLESILDDAALSITENGQEGQKWAQWLTSFLNSVAPDGGLSSSSVVSLYTRIIELIIRIHVRCLEEGDFKGAAVIKDCNRLIIRAERFGVNDELNEQRERVHLQDGLLESLQLMNSANEMLHLVLEQETISTDTVWDIVDTYRRVIVLTREKLVEVEAEAYSHTARIFRVILHDHDRAKHYYKLCVHLCLSMSPKMMDSHSWYQECVEANRLFQIEEDRIEEEARLRDTSVLREEMKAELEELYGKKDLSVQKIMEWLLQRHPVKTGDPMEQLAPDAAPLTVKRYLLNVIRRYHPDRNENQDPKWRYLCGKITTLLNGKYEFYK
ncbi:hypothetical protein PROFUN_00495 [Planoprotostelium fungivorum]|uniref:J domain-containing protein n=1 Tax=Planoprotostelium fungivorum TaxID=1890364 RepID=A0A2P6N0Z7_9EUKA|nr:hypothetical protein PROFUN_00495 [Planoprotostelium fungivorum]